MNSSTLSRTLPLIASEGAPLGGTVPKTPVFITTGSAGTQGASATRTSSESTDASISSPFPDATTADGPNTNSNLNTGLSLSSVPEMPAMGNMPQEKASASLQVLFLVILGALAFAGIIASLIHRMSRMGRRRHGRSRRPCPHAPVPPYAPKMVPVQGLEPRTPRI